MSKINDLIKQYCPNGVEYRELKNLFSIQTGRLNVSRKPLKDRYIVPPFSILNTITQNWQKRK